MKLSYFRASKSICKDPFVKKLTSILAQLSDGVTVSASIAKRYQMPVIFNKNNKETIYLYCLISNNHLLLLRLN